ncbi:MAG: LysR family transcriptional regulator [Verrucomicrobiota bacterium]
MVTHTDSSSHRRGESKRPIQGIELRHLRYFVAVVREGSITRAAHALHTSQPSLGKQLRDLERRLGIQLFEKSKPGSNLTDAGKGVFARAEKLLGEWSSWIQSEVEELERFKTPLIRILAPEPIAASTSFAELLRNLRAACPDFPFEVVDPDEESDLFVLLDGEVDFLCTHGKPADDREVDSFCVAKGTPFALLPPKHPLSQKEKVTKPELSGIPLISLSRNRYPRLGAAFDEFWKPDDSPEPIREVRHLATALELVSRGDGFMLSPGLRYSRLLHEFAILPVSNAPDSSLHLVWKRKVLSEPVGQVANSVPHLPPIIPSSITGPVSLAR